MEKIHSFEDLLVWKKSHALALEIYKLTRTFPAEEKFCMVPQMRRSALSIPANIAEGFKRRSKKDKINFYNISQGSLSELQCYVILAKDLGYINNFDLILIAEVGKMLNGLIASIERSP